MRGVQRLQGQLVPSVVLPNVRTSLHWSNMVELVNTLLPHDRGNPPAQFGPEFVFLGVLENGHTLPRSLAPIHMLMWKFVIRDLFISTKISKSTT